MPTRPGLEEAPWAVDFAVVELAFHGRVALPAWLATVEERQEGAQIELLCGAGRLYHHPDGSTARLDVALGAYPADGDPLWPALARHVARRSTKDDRLILEDLCRIPEAPKHPANREYRERATKEGMPEELQEIIWGLKYIVRGDILLSDGTEVTLDELADKAGVPRVPYLEEMPEYFEVKN